MKIRFYFEFSIVSLLLFAACTTDQSINQSSKSRLPGQLLADMMALAKHGNLHDSKFVSTKVGIEFSPGGWKPDLNRFGEYYGKMTQVYSPSTNVSEFGKGRDFPVRYQETTFEGGRISSFIYLPINPLKICITTKDIQKVFGGKVSRTQLSAEGSYRYDFQGENNVLLMIFVGKQCVSEINFFQNISEE
jgi:hypothetical protein